MCTEFVWMGSVVFAREYSPRSVDDSLSFSFLFLVFLSLRVTLSLFTFCSPCPLSAVWWCPLGSDPDQRPASQQSNATQHRIRPSAIPDQAPKKIIQAKGSRPTPRRTHTRFFTLYAARVCADLVPLRGQPRRSEPWRASGFPDRLIGSFGGDLAPGDPGAEFRSSGTRERARTRILILIDGCPLARPSVP